jgi:predicted DNA binding CopG/RHH family protein
MAKLNAEEKEILEAFEAGKLTPVARMKSELKRHQEYAAATFQKDSRINIRISSKDLRLLQKRALSEGLPYQTLISSLLHKYVEGRLVENQVPAATKTNS